MQARHTGIKIVQQIAILMGCAVLPHLKSLVEIIENGLVDEQQKVRTITALALAALAEAATPYGIEAFDSVLVRLWKGIRCGQWREGGREGGRGLKGGREEGRGEGRGGGGGGGGGGEEEGRGRGGDKE